jgi:putative endonuclease
MPYYVYILASRKHGTLYIGVTSDIARRVWEHRQGRGSRFVQKYCITRLVHIETHEEIERAIQREKTLKEWPRAWKIQLIERGNPEWDDLYDRISGQGIGSRGQAPGRQRCVYRHCGMCAHATP